MAERLAHVRNTGFPFVCPLFQLRRAARKADRPQQPLLLYNQRNNQ